MKFNTEVHSEQLLRKRSRSLPRNRDDVLNYHTGVKKARISADEIKKPLREEEDNMNTQGKYGASFAFLF